MKGDGSITPIKGQRGAWRVCMSTGRDPITGRYGKVQRIVRGTKADARAVRDAMRRDLDNGIDARGGRTPFADYAAQWLEARRASGEVGATRLERLRGIMGVISGYIGGVALQDLTPQVVESLYQRIREERGISGTTAHMYHQALKQCLGKAVDYGLIARNPCDRATAPKAERPARRSLTALEAARLLASVDSEERTITARNTEIGARRNGAGNGTGRVKIGGFGSLGCLMGVRVAMATGMRRGEVFALAWGNVRTSGAPFIRVVQSITTAGEVKAPKSAAGIRTISIDAATASRLSRWRDYQRAELARLGMEQDAETPVCCSCTGGYMDLHNFERWWKGFRDAHGFEGLRFHELRHTQATQLLANGVDVKTVQARLGHASASLTLDQYAHALPANDRRAAELLGDVLRGGGCEVLDLRKAV